MYRIPDCPLELLYSAPFGTVQQATLAPHYIKAIDLILNIHEMFKAPIIPSV